PRQIRPRQQGIRRLPGGSHDGLPQPQRDHRRGNRIVARAETSIETPGCEGFRRAIGDPMRHNLEVLFAAALVCGISAVAQSTVPEIAFDSVVDPLKFPANIHLGEAAGIATNSKGDVFVYTRTGHPTISIGTARPFAHGGSRLFQFDKTGKFVREIGQDSYGFLVAQQVRIDPQDNIWVVDQMSSMVMKFDPNGQIQLLLGRKSESERLPAAPAGPAGPGGPAGP